MVIIKRIYDEPGKEDGFRILVDRLWPRGIYKEKAKLGLWLKDIAPSSKWKLATAKRKLPTAKMETTYCTADRHFRQIHLRQAHMHLPYFYFFNGMVKCKRACLPTHPGKKFLKMLYRTTKTNHIIADSGHIHGRQNSTGHNSYTQAGVSCFVGQESSKFKVQCFVGSSVVKILTCV